MWHLGTDLLLLRRISQRGGRRIGRKWGLQSHKKRLLKKSTVIQCQGSSELKKDEDQEISIGLTTWASSEAFAKAVCYQNDVAEGCLGWCHTQPSGALLPPAQRQEWSEVWVLCALFQHKKTHVSRATFPARSSLTFTNMLPRYTQ